MSKKCAQTDKSSYQNGRRQLGKLSQLNASKCNNSEIDDATRNAYLDAHNEYRWWRELPLYGVNIEMRFTSEVRHRQDRIVTHFTKMAWHDNVRLGCGHHRCDGFIFAVCHYGPG
ncbi:hypothetical protein TELCIR_11346, partial [Teladorsagia circumcincta]